MRSFLVLALGLVAAQPGFALKPIPDKLVVLTFDDASKSHFTVARPLLQKYKFGATFFISEGWDFATNKKDYMTWEEIKQLHQDGFEIGNHTRDHMTVKADNVRDLSAQLRAINARCKEHGIPQPTSFAYPGNGIAKEALSVLKELGIQFARRGGVPEFPYKEGRGFAYEPGLDHPLLVPTAGDARPTWTLDDLKRAVAQAKHGCIAVLQFHGVPDTAHDWVTTSREQFESYLKYLAEEKCTVIAMRDLAKYVDPSVVPGDPWGVVEDRKKLIEKGRDGSNSRPAKTDEELKAWLANMTTHRFAPGEMGAALGLTADEATAAIKRLRVEPLHAEGSNLLVLPYPGGRHPRIGFRDGAIRPQRETKISVFAPWADGGFAVADLPEAIWFEPDGKRELLYLAHTHVPTVWDKAGTQLESLEWSREKDGSWRVERMLPNKVAFGSSIHPDEAGVQLLMWVKNGSAQKLTGLNVQMCVMLAGLAGYEERTNDNKVFDAPFAACRDKSGKRWIITGWQECGRAWGNAPCPCLHSDPKIPDCAPGETRKVRGWLSFYEGTEIASELKRLRARLTE
jgi:peptidoglycan/xylan/chitin deacetylase (PgdA/CDA1 family)